MVLKVILVRMLGDGNFVSHFFSSLYGLSRAANIHIFPMVANSVYSVQNDLNFLFLSNSQYLKFPSFLSLLERVGLREDIPDERVWSLDYSWLSFFFFL